MKMYVMFAKWWFSNHVGLLVAVPRYIPQTGWLWFSQLLILVFRVMSLKTIWANYNYPSRRVGHPKTWFSNGIPSKMSETFSFRNYTVDGSKISHQYGETTIIYEDFAQLRSMVYWVICPENIPSNHPTHQILPISPPHGPPQSDDSAADRHRGASCDLGSKCAWVAVRQFENPETPVDWHDMHQFSHLDVLRLLKNPYMVGYYNHLYTVNIQNFGHGSLLGRMHLFWWVFLLEQDIPCHKCVLPDSLFEGRLSPWAGGLCICLFVCLWYFYRFVDIYTPEN